MKWFAFLAAGMMSSALDVQAQTAIPQPFEQVRTLYAIQDEIARGKDTAHAAQRTYLQSMSKSFDAVDVTAWSDIRNARAALGFVLSGGEPKILRDLIVNGRLKGLEDTLATGVLAYGEGRNREALGLLRTVDARLLSTMLAGHVSLVQGIVAAESDAPFALARLEDAILLAPGTLVEESALRRGIVVALKSDNAARALFLLARYLRRFPRSTFAVGFESQVASVIAEQFDDLAVTKLQTAEAVFALIPATRRPDFYLKLSYEALLRGKSGLAGYAASFGKGAGEETTRLRARLYAAVAAVTTTAHTTALSDLRGIDTNKLPSRDRDLLTSALALAKSIHNPISRPGKEIPVEMTQGPVSSGIERAQSMLTKAGQLLGESP